MEVLGAGEIKDLNTQGWKMPTLQTWEITLLRGSRLHGRFRFSLVRRQSAALSLAWTLRADAQQAVLDGQH